MKNEKSNTTSNLVGKIEYTLKKPSGIRPSSNNDWNDIDDNCEDDYESIRLRSLSYNVLIHGKHN